MMLSETLRTAAGNSYDMAGTLPANIEMCDRYQALDHVELQANDETVTADAGETLRGHEFHYSRAETGGDVRFAFDRLLGRAR